MCNAKAAYIWTRILLFLIHAAGVALIIIMDYYVQFCLLFWSQVMICDVAKAFFLANVIGILLAIVFIILGCIRKHPPGLAVALDAIMLVIMLALTGFEAYFIYTTVNSLNVFFYAGCTAVAFFSSIFYLIDAIIYGKAIGTPVGVQDDDDYE